MNSPFGMGFAYIECNTGVSVGGMKMTEPKGKVILVLMLDQDTDMGLELWAIKQGWIVIRVNSIDETLEKISSLLPQVIIIQFSTHLDETLEVIQTMRQGGLQIPLIVVTSSNQEKIEQAIRGVGASCFFSGPGSRKLVGRAVTMITSRNLQRTELKSE
jgi:CheY-like chemotaxis protein